MAESNRLTVVKRERINLPAEGQPTPWEESRRTYARFLATFAVVAESFSCEIPEDDGRGNGVVRLAIAFDALARHGRHFEAGRNPLHAWQAYAIARRDKRAIPDAVLTYFDSCATRLLHPKAVSARSQAAIAAEALGIKRPGRTGRRNVFRAFHDGDDPQRRDLEIAAEVETEIGHGTKRDFAYEYVARERGVSRTTIRRAYSANVATIRRAVAMLQPWWQAMDKFAQDAAQHRRKRRKLVASN